MATYKKNNRLSSERSPYLLQHAANPVDWYPWGPEAFQKAKDDNKLIFLSVGYSTCHWCHVMERESFENCEVAKVMNDNFVCIKVDREERPDVDRIYMMFVQATTGHGGWPMSVWLTPDLKPVMGGTYFPPDGVYHGRPGFKTVLQSVAEKWQEDSGRFQEQGSKILAALKKASTKLIDSSQPIPSLACVETCYTQLSKRYDPKYGGFGQAPKFPQPVNIRFLLRMQHTCKEAAEKMDIMSMIVHTLKMMARGGMHDHVSQGFHRYSTDAKWHVPHFEKMLYDQAQLAVVYAEAYQVTQDDCFAEVCHDILRYVDRDLSNPAGGFYSAEDADSLPSDSNTKKKEGAFCVWTFDEIHQILSEKISGNVTMADVFSHHFDVHEGGNVDPYQDPHDELKNKNVLMVIQSVEDTADYFEIDAKTVKQILERGKQLLYTERSKRPRPHLDDKIITSWNGLMISGFAKCGQALGNQEYINRAKKGADFVRNHLFDHANNCLLRSSYCDKKNDIVQLSEPINGFLDDYAFLINGLLDLYECCFDSNILKWAEQLQDIQNKLFWDEVDGGYFSTSLDNESLILRMKDDQDGAEPCANSVAIGNLVRLANILKRDDLQEKLKQMLMLFGDRLEKAPIAVPEMVNCLMLYHSPVKQIIVCGTNNDEDTTKMMELINSKFLPDKVVILADGKEDNIIYERLELMSNFRKIDGKATAYVCKDFTCTLPVNDLQELEHLLS